MFRRVVLTLSLCALTLVGAAADSKPPKPGFNLFSKQQDVQIGQQAAAQVRQQYQTVNNPELQNYIRSVGERLAKTPNASQSGFPFSFTLLNETQVNAFALPGGPTFVFSGLIKSADNEAQLAGVLAHEISHVVLRHGTNQASKANLMQLPAALLGAVAGNSTMGQLVNLGLGLGLNGLFLKFSRTDESQADALGTRIMSEAGYNPIEMAHFFEKLQAQGGPGVPQFLSDHPNPGNRVKAVQTEIQGLPQRQYTEGTGQFPREKQLVAQLPPPPKQPRQGMEPQAPADGASGGYQALRGRTFALEYPAGWQAFGDNDSAAVTIAPRQGLVQGRNGNVEVGYGAMVSYFFPEQDGANLQQATDDLIHHLRTENPGMQADGNQKQVRVDGSQGLVTNLESRSPFGGTERDILLTVARPEGVFYMVFIAPDRSFGQLQGAFNHMVQSLRFAQ